MEILDRYMNDLLADLEKKLESDNIALAQLPTGYLGIVARNGMKTYFQVESEDRKRVRKSINKNKDVISALARKDFLKIEISLLEQNIDAVKRFLESYQQWNVEEVVRRLPKKYEGFPEDWLFPQTEETNGLPWPMEYVQSDYRPEGKTNMTSRGLRVRSKGEVAIAEMLYRYHVPFRYEQVLNIGKYTVAPDFILMRKNGELRYWEHCGLPGNQRYMERHKWKMDLYASVGIVPWKNLIVTYDDEDGTINMQIIESEIRNKLL